MRRRRTVSLKEGELRALSQRLDQKRLQAGDHELLGQVLAETKRLRRELWWMGLAGRALLGMLAVKNWVRRCQGKAPLVVEEGCDDER
jgi:hypothetical protein